MPHIERTAHVGWDGNLARGAGTLDAESGAFARLPFSLPSRVDEPGGKTSPEELLAAAHGGCITMSLAGELTSAGASDPVMGALPGRFEAFEWHSYAFEVPPGGVLLASSPVCAQAFKVGEAAWGVQFHPEVTLEMLEAWRAGSDGSAPPVPLEPVGRWNELGRALANAFFDAAR